MSVELSANSFIGLYPQLSAFSAAKAFQFTVRLPP
jgi:hypothetical protein